MDELDEYGSFNTRYEGDGKLWYIPGEPIPVYFEARQFFDGRLLVACWGHLEGQVFHLVVNAMIE